jgi:hypothetical protein
MPAAAIHQNKAQGQLHQETDDIGADKNWEYPLLYFCAVGLAALVFCSRNENITGR